ncbi:MAG TPA: ABC transporter ATP-binding protein [Casimicrobiaceae bacterium]|nr:ABC transporter ATP-binding protein [Casimicrobiaceae bacterium]
MALFEAIGLHKRFGDRVVLERIDLAFEAGSLTGIMGPNGAGKTTCFNCLTGMYAPDRGDIRLEGRAIAGLGATDVTRLGVARSFQNISLFDDDTALDNVIVALPAMRKRSFDAWRDRTRDSGAQDQAAAILLRVGLQGRELVRARDLAYGERRALEIGLALATAPKILFLDEPTSGLGASGTVRLTELVAELKRTLTMVIIEHDMRFLFRLADFINVIHWGQVIARGTPQALRANPWVQRSALGVLEQC